MSCMTATGRCTKCCEAIHIPMSGWRKIREGGIVTDSDKILKVWTRVSKRRAKKINPWIFGQKHEDQAAMKSWLTSAAFFKCKALTKEGCSIRDTEDHPDVCKLYTGGNDYSPTCNVDINIIARTG